MVDYPKFLTSGATLARSAIWNFVGIAGPMLLALIAIPIIIDGMGKDRFGLLALIWIGVGYFSFFDLGIGRALTKMLSERLGNPDQNDLGPLIWTTFVLLAALGSLGAITLLASTESVVTWLLSVPEYLHGEAAASVRILAFGIPVVILTAGLVGILEANQRFGVIAAIRAPLGMFTFGGPLITLQFTPSIAIATLVLLTSRCIALLAYYFAAASVCHELRYPRVFERHHVRSLLGYA